MLFVSYEIWNNWSWQKWLVKCFIWFYLFFSSSLPSFLSSFLPFFPSSFPPSLLCLQGQGLQKEISRGEVWDCILKGRLALWSVWLSGRFEKHHFNYLLCQRHFSLSLKKETHLGEWDRLDDLQICFLTAVFLLWFHVCITQGDSAVSSEPADESQHCVQELGLISWTKLSSHWIWKLNSASGLANLSAPRPGWYSWSTDWCDSLLVEPA